jgi:DNA topoisomerase-1
MAVLKLPASEPPVEIVALTARLVYVSDAVPGITRRRSGDGWSYRDPDGRLIRDRDTLAHIRALAIPPAYRDVWISPDPNGHIQASGRDARGRKQYRYHPAWRNFRDAAKYERVASFIRALPTLRARVAADLARPGLPRDKVLATLVRLMETTFIRVGNTEYAKTNKSFGLTTLRNRHARVGRGKLELTFQAKSGIKWHVVVRNRRLVALVRRLRELPGQELFQYLDETGARHAIGSADVNDYLRAASAEEITAKDFRTWAGTHLAVTALAAQPPEASDAARKRGLLRAVEAVAATLGNTPAICRKCYIHPAVLDAHMTGTLAGRFAELVARYAAKPQEGLTAEEAAVMALVERA